MDAPISSEEDNNMYDVLQSADTPSPDKNLINESLAYEIERALSTLSPRESKVLKLYFGLGMKHPYTLEEIGEEIESYPGKGETNKRKSHQKDPVYNTLQDTEIIPGITICYYLCQKF